MNEKNVHDLLLHSENASKLAFSEWSFYYMIDFVRGVNSNPVFDVHGAAGK
jgi:hypothetical protein